MKKSFLLFTLCLTNLFVCKLSYSQNVKAFYIGHSLTDGIPEMVHSLSVNDGTVSFNNWAFQSVPGASLQYQWGLNPGGYSSLPPAFYGYYDATNGLPNGTFTNLVLTESVPRANGIYGINLTHQYADSFFNFAIQENANTKIYIYEVWHCLLSGTPTGCAWDGNSNPWRQRLTDDLPMWTSVVDTLNNRYNPINDVCLIPGGQGLARLYDSIIAGVVPGITTINDLFVDDIHLSDQGKYFIACIHFAMLHNKSPIGLTNQLTNLWGGSFNAPTQAQALKFQEIAWQTVSNLPGTCLASASPLSIQNNNDFIPKSIQISGNKISIAPNPAHDYLKIIGMDIGDNYKVFNLVGQEVLSGVGEKIDVRKLDAGIYTVIINDTQIKFIKE